MFHQRFDYAAERLNARPTTEKMDRVLAAMRRDYDVTGGHWLMGETAYQAFNREGGSGQHRGHAIKVVPDMLGYGFRLRDPALNMEAAHG